MRQTRSRTHLDGELVVASLVETPLPPSPQTTRRRVLFRVGTSLLLVAVVVAFLAGVTTNAPPPWPNPDKPVAPKHGGSIVDGIAFEPDSLLPMIGAGPDVGPALWAPLWYGDPHDPPGVFRPGLATEVPSVSNGDVSADYTTWTIHLRSGLKWSDGVPLTADDCAFSFNIYATWPGYLNFPSTDPADAVGFAGATADESKNTVVLQVRHSFSRMPEWLADTSTCLPKHVFAAMSAAEVARSPQNLWPTVTSGPFTLKEWVHGDHITVVRNPYYYQGPDKPYLGQITFKFLSNHVLSNTDILTALQTHVVDTYWGLDPALLPSYRAIPGYTTYLDPYPIWYEELAFNLADPMLSDHAVRQAITMGIDRSTIITTIFHGAATPTCDDSVGTFAHEPNLTCYTGGPSAAAALLDADGWTVGTDGYRHKNGQALELDFATTTYFASRAATQKLIQDELAAIGIKIDRTTYTQIEYFSRVLSDEHFQIAEFANNNVYDPDDSLLFESDMTPDQGGLNFMRYASPQVDQLEDDQYYAADTNQRMADFRAIHADILNDLPVMYLYAPLDVSCARGDMHNFEPSSEGAFDAWNIWDWWLG